jgi:hypothetical protein
MKSMSYVSVDPDWTVTEDEDQVQMITFILYLISVGGGSLVPYLLKTCALWYAGFDFSLIIPEEYRDLADQAEIDMMGVLSSISIS